MQETAKCSKCKHREREGGAEGIVEGVRFFKRRLRSDVGNWLSRNEKRVGGRKWSLSPGSFWKDHELWALIEEEGERGEWH